MKNSIRILLFFLLCNLSALKAQTTSGIYINEFLASNNTTPIGGYSGFDDWIELYNSNPFSVDLAGYYMTDILSTPTKFRFTQSPGSVVIPANGFLIIIASGNTSLGNRHLNFSLSAGGEQIGLFAPNGSTPVDTLTYAAQSTDISRGRKPDGSSNWRYFLSPTIGTSNNAATGYADFLAPPQFSHEAGFYSTAFNLILNSAEPGATVYYTLDGSEPDSANLAGTSFQYKNSYPENPGQGYGPLLTEVMRSYTYGVPISITNRSSSPNKVSNKSSTFSNSPGYFPANPVFKGTVVKAKTVKPGFLPSKTVTNTFFVTPNPSQRFSLPVVSISTNESNLFSYTTGIYNAGKKFDDLRASDPTFTAGCFNSANYTQEGDAWERRANVEFFVNTLPVLNQSIGLRVHGGCSRAIARKSLRLYSDTEFDYGIFPDVPALFHKRLLLRNGGNDYNSAMIRDLTIQEMVKHLRMDTQAGRPSVLFLNGEYWGIHDIMERYDKYYLQKVYGINPDSVDIYKIDKGTVDIEEGDAVHYNRMIQFVDNYSLSVTANYDSLKTYMDPDNFIDYQITEIYVGNIDWPFNNYSAWRAKKNKYLPNAPLGHDGRWRWFLFDTDFGLGYGTDPSHNTLAHATNSSLYNRKLLSKLLNNTSFKNDFINRFADLLNTAFHPTRTTALINEMKTKYTSEMTDHIERWENPSSKSAWENNVNSMVTYAQQRQGSVRDHIRSKFSLSANRTLTVNVSDTTQGYIKVNTIDIIPQTPGVGAVAYPWSGVYFQGVPISITAKPKKGYKFLHWLYNGTTLTSATLMLSLTQNVSYVAVFAIDLYSENPFPIAKALNSCGYTFKEWSKNSISGSFPEAMSFVYMNAADPGLAASIADTTAGRYNLSSRTRITGLDSLGISFINTSNLAGNTGYPGNKLGGALLALNTMGYSNLTVKWTGGTVVLNSTPYRIRLQCRVGDLQDFVDVLDANGQPVEYIRNAAPNHRTVFGPIALPQALMNKPYIQLFWRYYTPGPIDGARDELRLDDIIIQSETSVTATQTGMQMIDNQTVINAENILMPTARVKYQAGKYVLLLRGFEAKSGVVFDATAAGCN